MDLNIDNAILVRSYKDYIPMSKSLKPSCEEKYLHYEVSSDYKDVINKWFLNEYEEKNNRKLNPYNNEDYEIIRSGVLPYLPLTSTYVSTLSFSINGLVHDDMNNFFSNYKICILEPLKDHLNDNYINFTVNDTTIKGNIELGNNTILLIDENLFSSLSPNAQDKLKSLYQLETFSGSLKNAVDDTLKKNGYPNLDIVNSAEKNYIINDRYKASEFISSFAKQKNISKKRLYDIYTSPFLEDEVDLRAQEKVSDEEYKIEQVSNYYKNNFYDYLVSLANENGFDLSEEEKFYLKSEYLYSKETVEKLVYYLINHLGYEQYSKLIQAYNVSISNNFITNEEIINKINNDSYKI